MDYLIWIVAGMMAAALIIMLAVLFKVRGAVKQAAEAAGVENLNQLRSETDRIREESDRQAAEIRTEMARQAAESRAESARQMIETREELSRRMNEFKSDLVHGMGDFKGELERFRGETQESAALQRNELENKLSNQFKLSGEQLDGIRESMKGSLSELQDTNERRLKEIQGVVDEKLQETLNKRIAESFETVQKQLMAVSEGLGDMQRLATDVGDLRDVLKNVKTKGILGEYQLAAIIEEILPREQYEQNIATKEDSQERVEFAVKFPGDGEVPVYLPIDAKFPSKPYEELLAARETGSAEAIAAAQKSLSASIKQSAKSISEKYVQPPNTTDFAIMFLPFEGLYAEVINIGLVDELQRLYKVNIAGPTTMAALLNSLYMGFRTLAIQKRSAEVWNILSAVKTEFQNFEKGLAGAQNRINQANSELDKLIGTRTRAINRKLKGVSTLTEGGTPAEILEIDDAGLRPDTFGDENA